MSSQADFLRLAAAYVGGMSDVKRGTTIRWLAAVVLGAGIALLLAWLDRLAGVPARTLLSIGAVAAALVWLVVLLSVPWNLHFAARRVIGQVAVSRERGIEVPQREADEAERIARRTLLVALGGHLVTAAATAAITYAAGSALGYYFTGCYLLAVGVRPAVAYLGHVSERIRSLSRESLHPRDDVVSLRNRLDELAAAVKRLTDELPQAQRAAADALSRSQSTLTADLAHTRQLLSGDLVRVQEAQAADREAARSRDEALGRRIDQVARDIERTLDGISDHQDLQAGLRALARMIRSDAS